MTTTTAHGIEARVAFYDRICAESKVSGCADHAAVRIEWSVSDGRVSGLYCVDHAHEIVRTVAWDVTFVEMCQPSGGPAIDRLLRWSSYPGWGRHMGPN
jgi:hypothetical protein